MFNYYHICVENNYSLTSTESIHYFCSIYRQLQLIISELIATERDYITALQFIIDNYLPQIVRDDVPQSLRGKRNLVFGNIENIYAFHSQFFLRELEACERHPLGIGTCFLNHEQVNWRSYVLFVFNL